MYIVWIIEMLHIFILLQLNSLNVSMQRTCDLSIQGIHCLFVCLFAIVFDHPYHLLYSLAHHYQNSPGKRALTFKYKVKAADIAISRGAYTDGLRFAQSSSKFAVSKEELRVLLLVISRALRDINSSIEIHAHGRRRSLSFSTTTDMEQQARIASYIQLKLTTEASLEKLTKGVVTPGEVTPGNKNRLVIKKQPSARLTWQPSYVASKLNEDNSDDDDDDEEEEVKKKGMCVIS